MRIGDADQPILPAYACGNSAKMIDSEGKEIAIMKVEIGREEDGRWIAEVPDLPGVMVYGETREQAVSKAEALARSFRSADSGTCKGRP